MTTKRTEVVQPQSLGEVLTMLSEKNEDTGWIRCEDEKGLQIATRVWRGRIETIYFRKGVPVGDEALVVTIGDVCEGRYIKGLEKKEGGQTIWNCVLKKVCLSDTRSIPHTGAMDFQITMDDGNRVINYNLTANTSSGTVEEFFNYIDDKRENPYCPVRSSVNYHPIDIGLKEI